MGAVLEVADDGVGFASDGHRPDAYGLLVSALGFPVYTIWKRVRTK